MKKLIIFVCNGNIYRSVVASEFLQKILKEKKIGSKFSVDSYGIQGTGGTNPPKHKSLLEYSKEWKAAKPTLDEIGVDVKRHKFQKISARIMKKADVIIAMDDKVYSRAKNSLTKQFSNYSSKIHRFSELTSNRKAIKDPLGNGDKKFHKKTIQVIYSTLDKKYKRILGWSE